MLSQVNCPICKGYIARAHGNMHNQLIAYHIKQEHPQAYSQAAQLVREIRLLEDKLHALVGTAGGSRHLFKE